VCSTATHLFECKLLVFPKFSLLLVYNTVRSQSFFVYRCSFKTYEEASPNVIKTKNEEAGEMCFSINCRNTIQDIFHSPARKV
jgi:hypothetical protein